jgi:outer membrane immunogenic protein
MKSFAVAASILAISAAGASAADMASQTYTKAPLLVAPIFSWTGFYAGLNAGYADPTANFSVIPGGSWIGDPDQTNVVNAGTRGLGLRGFTGGLQAGYNYQVGRIVLGIEGDANYLGLKNSYSTPVLPGFAGLVPVGTFFGVPFFGLAAGHYQASGSAGLDAFYTLRGRVGYTADHWLFFATGGLAVTSEKFSQNISFVNQVFLALPLTGPAGGANAGSASRTAASWTLGGGVEYALNQQWSVKGEYLYVNLDSMSFSSVYGPSAFSPGTYTIQHNLSLSGLNIFRAGLNYHF